MQTRGCLPEKNGPLKHKKKKKEDYFETRERENKITSELVNEKKNCVTKKCVVIV